MLVPMLNENLDSSPDSGRLASSMTRNSHPNGQSSLAVVRVTVSKESEDNFYSGFNTNGIYCVTHNVLPLDTEVVVMLYLPRNKRLLAIGTVRWLREYNPTEPDMWPAMGIEFNDVNPYATKVIRKFCSVRESLFLD